MLILDWTGVLNMYLLMVTYENGKNYSIRFEMKTITSNGQKTVPGNGAESFKLYGRRLEVLMTLSCLYC